MEQRQRRWLVWSVIGSVLIANVLTAAFFAYWYVVWPFPSRWVINTSPWLEPQLRAWAKSEGANDGGYDHISRSVESRGLDAYPVLLACLRSSDQRLRRETIIFMQALREVGHVPRDLSDELVRASGDLDPEIARGGCWAMGFLPQEWSRPALKQVLARRLATHFDARKQAMRYLAKQGGRELVPLIIPDLHDSEPTIRMSAISALKVVGDPAANDEVRKLADDPDLDVRLNVESYFRR